MPTIIENFEINPQVCIFFLIDLDIGHCVEFTSTESWELKTVKTRLNLYFYFQKPRVLNVLPMNLNLSNLPSKRSTVQYDIFLHLLESTCAFIMKSYKILCIYLCIYLILHVQGIWLPVWCSYSLTARKSDSLIDKKNRISIFLLFSFELREETLKYILYKEIQTT